MTSPLNLTGIATARGIINIPYVAKAVVHCSKPVVDTPGTYGPTNSVGDILITDPMGKNAMDILIVLVE